MIYTNHASWWDPLVGLLIACDYFPHRKSYAPIDAEAVQKYKFLLRLGFYPVETHNKRGAVSFLNHSRSILSQPDSILWLTPQGCFADVRRPPEFRPGLGHLPRSTSGAWFVPLAIEYSFWEERLPEVFARFGEPLWLGNEQPLQTHASEWTTRFEQELASAQRALALQVINRDPQAFHEMLRGRAGVGGIYDWWRSFVALVRGRKLVLAHGNK